MEFNVYRVLEVRNIPKFTPDDIDNQEIKFIHYGEGREFINLRDELEKPKKERVKFSAKLKGKSFNIDVLACLYELHSGTLTIDARII